MQSSKNKPVSGGHTSDEERLLNEHKPHKPESVAAEDLKSSHDYIQRRAHSVDPDRPEQADLSPETGKEEPKPVYYTKQPWKGVMYVFTCTACKTFRTQEDEIILHVLEHYPKAEQPALLEKLISEKEKV